jgi:hypothetical protein
LVNSSNADLVSGKRVLKLDVEKGAVKTEEFEDMSTMRPSYFTEVTKANVFCLGGIIYPHSHR